MNALNYFLILLLLNMKGDTKFENFIGKDIETFKAINSPLKHRDDLNKYYMFSEVGYEFYGKTYHNATITTDNENIIKDITIYMNGIVDKTFYDVFNNNYGAPSDILVVDYAKEVSRREEKREEKVEEELSATAKKVISFMKKGKFEDKPQYLIWNKKGYQIRIFLRYDIKMSEIKFTLPTD